MNIKDVPLDTNIEPTTTPEPPQAVTNVVPKSWFEIKGLPSKGLIYPKNTKLEGSGFSFQHLRDLSFANDVTSVAVMKQIAKDCIRGIDVDALCPQDLQYCFLWIRANSMVESDFNMTYTCAHCNEISPVRTDPSEFNIKYLEEVPNNFVGSNGDVIGISVPTSGREQSANVLIDKLSTLYDSDDKLPDWRLDFEDDINDATWMSSLNDVDVDVEKSYEYLKNLNVSDSLKLIRHIRKYNFGISEFIQTNCTRCAKPSEVEVNFQQIFFFPTI